MLFERVRTTRKPIAFVVADKPAAPAPAFKVGDVLVGTGHTLSVIVEVLPARWNAPFSHWQRATYKVEPLVEIGGKLFQLEKDVRFVSESNVGKYIEAREFFQFADAKGLLR